MPTFSCSPLLLWGTSAVRRHYAVLLVDAQLPRTYRTGAELPGHAQDAVAKHWFRQGHAPDGDLDLPAVLATAAEIAAGMSYLHARGIVHGDLTGANILLASCPVRGTSF